MVKTLIRQKYNTVGRR